MVIRIDKKNSDYEKTFLIPYERANIPKELLRKILNMKEASKAYSHCSINAEKTTLTFSAISKKIRPPHCREMKKMIFKRKNGCNDLSIFHKHWHTMN